MMGDLGWVAYPKNGVSMTSAKMVQLLVAEIRINKNILYLLLKLSVTIVSLFLDWLSFWRLLEVIIFMFFDTLITPYDIKTHQSYVVTH